MRFKRFIEDELSNQAMVQSPASAEVIKTGLQPQVDAKEIKTKQKEEHDLLLAIDGHLQRVKSIIEDIGRDKGEKGMKIKEFCKKFLDEWEQVKAGKEEQQDAGGLAGNGPNPYQVDFMKRNQPLPEQPRQSGPGTFGIDP